jgi:hypothetical protein
LCAREEERCELDGGNELERSGCEVATLNVAGLLKLAFMMLILAGLISCVITCVLDFGDFPRGCFSPRDRMKLLSFDLGV